MSALRILSSIKNYKWYFQLFLLPSICSVFLLRSLMAGKIGRNSKEIKLCSLTARIRATLVNDFHITSHSSGVLIKHISIKNILVISF